MEKIKDLREDDFVRRTKPVVPKPCYKNLFCGVDGELPKDTDACFAKKEWNGKNYDFYIKRSTGGPDVGHLLNPWGMYFEQADLRRYDSHLGKKRYEFSKVTEESFQAYLAFLNTRNEIHLRNAERILD